PKTYFLQACADGGGDVSESVETNNCLNSVGTIQVLDSPDLMVTAVSNPPATATQGQAIQAAATVKNIGTVAAAETTSRYYLVASAGSGKIDLKGKPVVPAIAPGGTYTEKDSLKVRVETVPAKYFLQACVDAGKVLAEKDENNNCLTTTSIVTVLPQPNLVTT